MNNLEISDINKLKNTLSDLGIKFKETKYESTTYIDLIDTEGYYTTAFAFTPSGKFSHISEG